MLWARVKPLEFKRANSSGLGRELCALANAQGGYVLIGVDDHGQIHPLRDANKLKSEVQSIARSMDPPLGLSLELVAGVLVIEIAPQRGKPFSFAGKFYLREGATSQQLGRDEIKQFFFEEGLIRFDETTCEDFVYPQDLDPAAYQRFAQHARVPLTMEPSLALRNLRLLEQGRLTQAGAWLLSPDITRVHRAAHLSCALFMGVSKTRILDRKNFSADLYRNFESAMTWLLGHLNTAFQITGGVREEQPEIPEAALRESLLNAIAHRDYRSPATIQIYLFQDRLEIVSPGGLPAGLALKDLGQRSVPRNPLLFGILYRMGLIEQIGSGVQRMRDLCQEAGLSSPQIEVDPNWFSVVFQRPVPAFQETAKPASDYQSDYQSEPIQQVLKLLQAGPQSSSELMASLGLKHRSSFLKNYLKPALAAQLIEMTQPENPRSRFQKYRLKQKKNA